MTRQGAFEVRDHPANQRWMREEWDRRHPEDVMLLAGVQKVTVVERLAGSSWQIVQTVPDGQVWRHPGERLGVIWTISLQDDQRPWLHVSVTKPGRVPDHEEMRKAKDAFIGEVRYAYAVFPPKEVYVNVHERCLHLFAPAWSGEPPLPEFSHLTPSGHRVI